MKRTNIFAGLVAICLSLSAAANDSGTLPQDTIQNDLLALRAEMKAGPSDADVGDATSFGRNVKWLGLLQSGSVILTAACTPVPGDPPLRPDDRCVALNPAPAITTFDLPDIGRMTIPRRSAESLLCHWLTPIVFYQLLNSTGVTQDNATMRLTPYVVVESEVLNDPTLINPSTGLPFGGRLESGFAASYADSRSMDPGERQLVRHSQTRTCIAGFVSKRGLVENFGFSESQARSFFRSDITLRFGLRGSAALVTDAVVIYGLRVVGD